MAAVVDRELDVALLGQALAPAVHDGDVGAAEAVDRLLDVADRREAQRPLAGEQTDELVLLVVGVLELVDHDEAEAAGVVGRDGRVVAHGLEGELDEVVVAEHGRGALELRDPPLHLLGAVEKDVGVAVDARKRERRLRLGEVLLDDLDLGRVAAAGGGQPEAVDDLEGLAGVEGGGRQGGERVETLEPGGDLLGVLVLQLEGQEAAVVARDAREDRAHVGGLREAQGGVTAGRRVGGLHDGDDQAADARGAPGVDAAEAEVVEEAGEDGALAAPVVDCAHDLVQRGGLDRGLEVRRGDREVGVEAQVEGVSGDDALAHAVDRRDPGGVDLQGVLVHAGVTQGGANALLDLAGRGIGEGDDQDLRHALEEGRAALARAVGERPRDAAREREGLARAGARLHEEGRVERLGNLPLLVVQAF